MKNRIEVKNGLYYKNETRCVLLYDKTREVASKREDTLLTIPKENNYMRVEYRIMKHQALGKLLRLIEVTFEDIIINYPDLVKAWFGAISSINKFKPQATLDMTVFKKRGGIDDQIKLMGLKAIGGFNALKNMVESARKIGVFKYPNQATNILSKYRRLMATTELADTPPLIEELERKIKIALFVHIKPSFELLKHHNFL